MNITKRLLTALTIAVLLCVCGAFASMAYADSFSLEGETINLSNENLSPMSAEGELTDCDAYLTKLSVTNCVTGTQPFDAESGPGKDVSSSDDVVRSFDKVFYTVEATYATRSANSYDNGLIWYEMHLPFTQKQAVFDIDGMAWMNSHTITVDADGHQTLLCSRKLITQPDQTSTIPGSNALTFIINVLALDNNVTVQPTVRAWMDHNASDGECPTHGVTESLSAIMPVVKVSAKLMLNVELLPVGEGNLDLNQKLYDFSTGNAYARNKDKGVVNGVLRGYGLTLQLRNLTGDGLKGVEFPTGPISVTVDMHSVYHPASGSSSSAAEHQPLLWSYDGNNDDMLGIDGREGNADPAHPSKAYANGVAPFNTGANRYSCYNGGTWTATEQNGSLVTFTVTDYEIDPGHFPAKKSNSNLSYYDDTKDNPVISVGCFSAAEIWILQPMAPDASGHFRLFVDDGGLNATSASGARLEATGTDTSNQIVDGKDDKTDSTVYTLPAGTYRTTVLYSYPNAGIDIRDVYASNDCRYNGKDSLPVGSNLSMIGGVMINIMTIPDNKPVGINTLIKFDASGLELAPDANGQAVITTGKELFGLVPQYFFGALPSGANWADEGEMGRALEEDLVWYPTLKALVDDGKLCVAVLREMRGHPDDLSILMDHQYFSVNARVRPDATPNKVYPLRIAQRVWSAGAVSEQLEADADYLVPSIVQTTDFANDYPIPTRSNNPDYNKAEYIGGVFAGGHTTTNGKACDTNCGDSLYVLAYVPTVTKDVVRDEGYTGKKNTFDLGYGQNIVNYVITPEISIDPEAMQWMPPEIQTTTLTIVDTLPAGLSYITNTAKYGDAACVPVSTAYNANGQQVITWSIDVDVTNPLQQLTFSAAIDASAGSRDYVNTVTIRSTDDYRDILPSNGNIATATITIIAGKQLSFSKSVLQRYYELNDDKGVRYRVSYDNSGGSSSRTMLVDVLPYPGDPFGSSFTGGATLNGWQLDLAALGADDASNVVLYYTTDTSYRKDSTTAICEGINEDEIRAEWSTLPLTVSDGKALADWGDIYPVAWAVDTVLPAGKSLTAYVNVKPDAPQPHNRFTNLLLFGNMTTQASGYYLQRSLSGMTWVDENGDGSRVYPEPALPNVTVTLYDASGAIVNDVYGRPCTMQTGADGRYSFTDLPAGTFTLKFSDGATMLAAYTASPTKKDKVPQDVNSDYTAQTGADGRLTAGVITNIVMPTAEDMTNVICDMPHLDGGFVPSAETLDLRVQKVWDMDSRITWRPAITLTLYCNNTATDIPTPAPDADGWYVYSGLPVFTNGKENVYHVTEAALAPFATTYANPAPFANVTDRVLNGGTITNKLDNLSLSVTKVWNAPADVTWRPDITLTLYQNGVPMPDVTPTVNGSVYTFSNLLPVLNDGTPAVYTVKEEPVISFVPGYSNVAPHASVTNCAHDGGTITNTYSPELVSIKVKKVWEGMEGISWRPDITLVLYKDGTPVDGATPVLRDGWYWFVNLMKHENGQEIVYTVTEEPVIDFTTSYSNTGDNAADTSCAYDGGTITNRYTPKLTEIRVQKVWKGVADDARLPAITLQLYCNGALVQGVEPVAEADGWYAFLNLPVRVNGKPAVYTVMEVPVPGYAATYRNEGEHARVRHCAYDKGVITNTLVPRTGDATPVLPLTLTALAAFIGGVWVLMRRRFAR